jgi:proteasome accessory factor B
MALYLGRRMLDPLGGTVFWLAAQHAFQKVRAALSARAVEYLDQFSGLFHHTLIGVADYAAKAGLIDELLRACEEQKATHILYQSLHATEPAFRDVHPYGLILHKAWLYLIALDPQEDRIKHYKVDRIERVDVSTFPFRRPDGFSLAEHLAETFGIYHSDGEPATVKVRFAPSVARYVQETKWKCSPALTRQRDGSLLAEFRLSGTQEIKSWLLSFGANAVVLEPEGLRAEIAEELETMRAAYARVPARGPSARRRHGVEK